jgi:HD-GYP domain-containing protein (c-di-GMP phosphodiesterase class II)
MGHSAARAELRKNAGTQFDERVVDAFLRALIQSGEGTDDLETPQVADSDGEVKPSRMA